MKKAFCMLAIAALIADSPSAQIAVKADTIYTMAGKKVLNGVVLIKGNKIDAVGANLSIPEGYTIYTANVVTPGIIDVRSTVGLSGAYNQSFDQNQLETSSSIQPELRAIDAYNPEDVLVGWLRQNGITTLHTGHGWGALMSGQTMVVKTKKGMTNEVVIVPDAMVAMTLGEGLSSRIKTPGNNSKGMAMLRSEFMKARASMNQPKKDSGASKTDLKYEVIKRMLNREMPALIMVQTASEILSAIRLAKEFNLDLILEGAAEAYRVIPQIKEAKARIIVHPTMMRAGGSTLNMTLENAAILDSAGFNVTIESGYEGYVPKTRVVLLEAAVAAANRLPRTEALKAITINPATLLGIADRVGSIEKGKDADLVLFNGDPFEYTTKPCIVIIDGKVEVENCKPAVN